MAQINASFEGIREYPESRTESYRFTITDLSDPMLHDLKALVRINNKVSRDYHRKLNMTMNSKYNTPLQTVRLRASEEALKEAKPEWRQRNIRL